VRIDLDYDVKSSIYACAGTNMNK